MDSLAYVPPRVTQCSSEGDIASVGLDIPESRICGLSNVGQLIEAMETL